MRLETIRAENLDSPGWLDRLTDKYKRDHAENLRKADQKRKRERLALVNEIATRLKVGKQDVATEVREPTQTLEVEKPTPTENKVDQKEILDLLSAIAETLEQHAEAIEALADKLDEIAETQSRRPTGRAPTLEKVELSQFDKEVIEKRFEQIGLNGEIRKVIRDPYIQGRFSG